MESRAVSTSYEANREPCSSRSEAINILTVTHLGLRTWSQAFGFWLARRPEWQARLAGSRPQSAQLKRLNFIHTARWVSVGRFPKFSRQSRLHGSRERWLPYRWMLFASNLNQGWEPYLQAFLDSFGSGIHTLWGDSVDFAGYPRPNTRNDMNEWIQHRLPVSQLYYCAYPHLTTNDIRLMLRTRRELLSVAADLNSLLAEDPNRNVSKDLDEFLVRIQHCLVDTAPEPDGWSQHPLHERVDENATGINGFVSLMPIRSGAEPTLIERLEALNRPYGSSVFDRVRGTHFARMTVLDRDLAAKYPNRDIRLKRSWLMFCADFDGRVDNREFGRRRRPKHLPHVGPHHPSTSVREYLGEVMATPELAEVFEFCYDEGGPPPPEAIVRDLVESVCPRRVYFRDYPDATLPEIREASRIWNQLLDHQKARDDRSFVQSLRH